MKTERVARLAKTVAKRLGLSEDAAADVELAASVKDIGRLSVPEELLARRGPLSGHDWERMSGHVLAGEALLLEVAEVRAVAPVVRSSHERWDGEGYPDGRSGEGIPLASRIIAACDAFVAMTTDRAFRPALDEATAINQVTASAWTQLDPAVARALVAELTGREIPESTPKPEPKGAARRGRTPRKDLLARLESLEQIPALPIVRERVLEALAEEHPQSGAVIAQLESDPGLTVCVLRSANNGAGRPAITSIPDAVFTLGWSELGRVARAAPALDFLWPQSQWEAALERFRFHAVGVQRAAVRLGEAAGRPDGDRLAIAALLHDIGRLALTQLRSGYMVRLGSVRSADERLRIELRDFGVDHATVGGIVARRLGIPDALAEMISEHHNVEAGPEAQLLCLADALAHHSQAKSAVPAPMIEVGHALGLSTDDLRTVTFELPHGDGSRRVRTEPSPLSRREREALQGLADGKLYGEIASALGVTTSTVRSHLHSVYRKLAVSDRAQAVLMATERGWL